MPPADIRVQQRSAEQMQAEVEQVLDHWRATTPAERTEALRGIVLDALVGLGVPRDIATKWLATKTAARVRKPPVVDWDRLTHPHFPQQAMRSRP